MAKKQTILSQEEAVAWIKKMWETVHGDVADAVEFRVSERRDRYEQKIGYEVTLVVETNLEQPI